MPPNGASPPRLTQYLLELLLGSRHAALIGDLQEEYSELLRLYGRRKARRLYCWRAAKAIPTVLLTHAFWSSVMLKNYLKIALRNVLKHKGFSLLNTLGLVAGLASFILIMLFVQHELSYDRFHSKHERIYRVATAMRGFSFDGIAKVAGQWGPGARANLPEVEQMTRIIFFGTVLTSHGDQRHYENGGLYVDSTFFALFDFPLLTGNATNVLTRPHTLVLTESLARKYFGSANPVGKTLTFENDLDYVVTGVCADPPANSHISFTFLASLASTNSPYWQNFERLKDNWEFFQAYTYLLLVPGSTVAGVEANLTELVRQHVSAENAGNYSPFLQPLTSIHLHSQLWRELSVNSDIDRVYLLSAIAFFILLIVCINYMNLATARSASRAKEVGVRKVAGAHRGALIRQLLVESVLLSLLALLLAVAVAHLALPAFNQLVGSRLTFDPLGDGWLLPAMVGLSVLVGVAAGSYPALVLSAFRPVQVLGGNIKTGGKASLRKLLVVVQFVISILLLIATGVVLQQLQYIEGKNLGFNQEHLVILPIRDAAMRANYETVKQALSQHSSIVSVSASANQPGGSDWGAPYRAEGIDEAETPPARMLVVDHDFFETYQIEVVQGRNFAREFSTDVEGALVLNETAVRELGWEQPLGKTIRVTWWSQDAQVIGVVKDFHFHSLHEQIGPLLIFLSPATFNRFTVRIRPERLAEALAFLEQTWAKFDPAHPFDYTFFDEQFGELHLAEQRLGRTLMIFAALAIFIACLGLLGLIAFTVQQRTKEIGVRKVFGAGTGRIFLLLSRDFVVLVGMAFVVAVPIGYLLLDGWLQNFAYRITLAPPVFVAAGFTALAIAWLAVGFQAVRAALLNPVDALRRE